MILIVLLLFKKYFTRKLETFSGYLYYNYIYNKHTDIFKVIFQKIFLLFIDV